MELLIAGLPLVGCAAMTLWCRRRMSQGSCAPHPRVDEIAALRAAVASLRAERSVGCRA